MMMMEEMIIMVIMLMMMMMMMMMMMIVVRKLVKAKLFYIPLETRFLNKNLFNSSFKFMMLANPGYASLLPRFTLPEGKIVRGQNCPILRNGKMCFNRGQ